MPLRVLIHFGHPKRTQVVPTRKCALLTRHLPGIGWLCGHRQTRFCILRLFLVFDASTVGGDSHSSLDLTEALQEQFIIFLSAFLTSNGPKLGFEISHEQ